MRVQIRVPLKIDGALVRYVDAESEDEAQAAADAVRADLVESAGLATAEWAIALETHAVAFVGRVEIAGVSETIDG